MKSDFFRLPETMQFFRSLPVKKQRREKSVKKQRREIAWLIKKMNPEGKSICDWCNMEGNILGVYMGYP